MSFPAHSIWAPLALAMFVSNSQAAAPFACSIDGIGVAIQCGEAEVWGETRDGVLETSALIPLPSAYRGQVSGAAGLVGAGPGGTSAGALASSNYGELHVFATTSAGAYAAGDFVRVFARAYAAFTDWATNDTDLPIEVELAVAVSGAFSGIGDGEGRVLVSSVSSFQQLVSDTYFLARNHTSVRRVRTFTLQPRETAYVGFALEADAYAGMGTFGGLTSSSFADLGNSGYLNMEVLTPGGKLRTASGHDYSSSRSSSTPVSEPGTSALMLAGLLALGCLSRRRTRP